MAKFKVDVEKMTESQVRETLQEIIKELDTLDGEDFFGTEGWKHFMGFED